MSRQRGSALYGLFGVMQSRNIRVPRGNMTPDQLYHSYYQVNPFEILSQSLFYSLFIFVLHLRMPTRY